MIELENHHFAAVANSGKFIIMDAKTIGWKVIGEQGLHSLKISLHRLLISYKGKGTVTWRHLTHTVNWHCILPDVTQWEDTMSSMFPTPQPQDTPSLFSALCPRMTSHRRPNGSCGVGPHASRPSSLPTLLPRSLVLWPPRHPSSLSMCCCPGPFSLCSYPVQSKSWRFYC